MTFVAPCLQNDKSLQPPGSDDVFFTQRLALTSGSHSAFSVQPVQRPGDYPTARFSAAAIGEVDRAPAGPCRAGYLTGLAESERRVGRSSMADVSSARPLRRQVHSRRREPSSLRARAVPPGPHTEEKLITRPWAYITPSTLDRTKERLQQIATYQLENPDTGAGSSTSPATGGHLGR